MKKKVYLLGGAAIVALLAGSTLFAWKWSTRNLESIPARRGDITEAVYGLGKIKTDRRFEVRLGILSTVNRLYVHEGQMVKKGERLIEFESNAVFRAPFDGTVTMIAAFAGETGLPQIPLLRLEDLDERYIELSLEQEGALRVRPGQKAKISVESLRGETLTGEVTALFARNEEFIAHVRPQSLAPSVLPGMTADVSVEVGKIANALLVPLGSVRDGTVLVRRANGKNERIKLEIGGVDAEWAEVKGGGLNEGDAVLIPKSRE